MRTWGARRHNLWLLADEVYERLYYAGGQLGAPAPSILRLCARDDAVVVVQSFSKTYCMTGWRVGWIVARSDLAQKAAQLNEFIISNAPSFAQRAAGDWDMLAAATNQRRGRREDGIRRVGAGSSVIGAEIVTRKQNDTAGATIQAVRQELGILRVAGTHLHGRESLLDGQRVGDDRAHAADVAVHTGKDIALLFGRIE